MLKLLFIALGYLSKGEWTIAVEFARRLPPDQFKVCFITTREGVAYVEQYQLEGLALQEHAHEANGAALDHQVLSFRPDYLIAADVYTLEHSAHWSGINFQTLRKYDVPIVSFDQYEWSSTDYMVDFYGNIRRKFPPLIEMCDYLIRNCPLNKPQVVNPKVALTSLYGWKRFEWRKSSRDHTDQLATSKDEKVVFIANSKWEYLNVSKLMSLGQLMVWMPKLLHEYLAALRKPLTVIHVGPVGWDFVTADHIRYLHFKGLPSAQFEQCLFGADLFITTNLASVTLSKAVFAGVPAAVVQNPKMLDFRSFSNSMLCYPDWFKTIAQEIKVVYPFQVFPWGWFEFLKPVMKDNPYRDCFATLPLLERKKLIQTLERLLYDPEAIAELRGRQETYVNAMLDLPSPAEVFTSVFAPFSW